MATGGDDEVLKLPTEETKNENSNEERTGISRGPPKSKEAWNQEDVHPEIVHVEEGSRVTFKCIMDPKSEIKTRIEEDDGVTFQYRVTSDKSNLWIKWFSPENLKPDIEKGITIKRASMKHDGTIFTAQIFRKTRMEETKTWGLSVKGTSADSQSTTPGSSGLQTADSPGTSVIPGTSAGSQSTTSDATRTPDTSSVTSVIPGTSAGSQSTTSDASRTHDTSSVASDRWDVKEIRDKERKDVDYYEKDCTNSVNFLIRILVHFLLFCITIACFFESKGPLHILLSLLGNENMQNSEMTNTRGIIFLCLFLILAVPDFMTICLYLLRWIFGKHDHPEKKMQREEDKKTSKDKKPTVKCIIVCYVVTELVQCFGVNAWIFLVCPYLSTVEMYVFPVAFVWPGVFRYITEKIRKKITNCAKLFIYVIFDVIQILITFSILIIITYFKIDKLNPCTIVFMWISTVLVPVRWIRHYIGFNDDDMDHNYSFFRWVVPIIRVFISTGFVLTYLLIVQPVSIPLQLFGFPFPVEQNPELTFNWTSVYTSGCTSGVFKYVFITNPENDSLHYFVFELFLTHLIASCLLYYFAVLACRICMQRVCFFFSLIIAAVVYPLIRHNFFIWQKDGVNCQIDLHEWVLFGLYYGSFPCQWFLMNNKLCEKQTKIMPLKKSLFTLPHYCSPIADLSLLHSRRIIDTGDDVSTDKKEQDKQSSTENSEPPNTEDSSSRVNSPQTGNTEASTTAQKSSERKDHETKVYICATMWHETMEEMKNLIFSILRLDFEHSLINNSRRIEGYEAEKDEMFEFEGHIFFDDAFETNGEKVEKNEQTKRKKVNTFVHQFVDALNRAVSEFYNSDEKIDDPECFSTVYGKRLKWKLPGDNSLFVHLKDKDKIRHKKRWSQVMYLYYLLGYKIRQCNEENEENTFVLTLDGDVNFYPMAIKRLLARMKNKPSVAASSGRIVPSGSGPVVWYQQFEYAVGHWLQKTTEHIFGCVLCSPGCFTLFRAKSLLSGEIMHNYTKISTEPQERVQYDQGEDRWLCTLLLKEGFRVEYFAAVQAKTSVPEEFLVLFSQRKRWIPSTIANIWDIIQNHNEIRRNNQNISFFYISYQFILLAATILGPSTILLAMDTALRVVFGFQSWHVYLFVYGPPVFYIYLCLKVNEDLQRTIGVVLSLAYSLLMLSVFIGTVVNVIKEGWYSPSALFLYVLFGVVLLAGIMHIYEILSLKHIFTYFIFLPLGFLFIPIYAICNMNDISWGTRENQTASDPKPLNNANERLITEINEYIHENTQKSSSNYKILKIFHMSYYLLQLKLFETVEKHKRPTSRGRTNETISNQSDPSKTNEEDQDSADINKDGAPSEEYKNEKQFWDTFVGKYLDPNPKNTRTVTQKNLDKFRNKIASMCFFFNAVWIVVVSSMNEVKHELNIIFNIAGNRVVIEPLGLVFMTIFALLLILQVIGMTLHRYSTFLYVMAATDNRSETFSKNLKIRKYVETLLSSKKYRENTTNRTDKPKKMYTIAELQEAFNRCQEKVNKNTASKAEERTSCFSFCRNKVGILAHEGEKVTPEDNGETGQTPPETSDNQNQSSTSSNSLILQKKFNLTNIFNQRMSTNDKSTNKK